ncbi:MAG TPA: RnfABCDGE type electron transport complex subunit D [bacterium]|nr:RnfABCDGE type electron transport complex subunit D [bacterium]
MSKSLKANSDLIPPHLHSGSSVAAHHWGKITALLPLCGISLWQAGLNALGIFAASLIGGLAAEILTEIFLKKKIKLLDGSSVLNSLLFALMVPPHAPYGMAAAGAFFGLLIGREIFGGLAAGPFLPALVGRVFLESCFPRVFLPQAVIFGNGWLAVIAILAGTVFLFSRKLIFWEAPLLYLAVLSILFLPSEAGIRAVLFSPFVLFSAFFLLTDPASAPLSVLGRRIFAGIAGMAVFLFNPEGASAPFVYALLTAEILTPWLDRLIRPSAARSL